MPDDARIATGEVSGTISESGPTQQAVTARDIAMRSVIAPAICEISGRDVEEVARAAAMEFNTVLATHAGADVISAAHQASLRFLLDLDLTSMSPDSALITEHPDWFVRHRHGIEFIYLSESDAAVAWWDSQMANHIAAGVDGFLCHRAYHVSSTIWRHLIDRATEKNPEVVFCAGTFGATPQQLEALQGAGFHFTFSSSCWWDYSASWLNEETERLARVAPPIAFAIPPGVIFPGPISHRRRAVALAAFLGAGWHMRLGIENAQGDDLATFIAGLNKLRQSHPTLHAPEPAVVASAPGASIAMLSRGEKFMLAANVSITHPKTLPTISGELQIAEKTGRLIAIDGEEASEGNTASTLGPAAIRLFEMTAQSPIQITKKTKPDCDAPRLAIEAITPKVDDGQFPVRRIVGDIVIVEADILADGHDKLAAELLYRPVTDAKWQSTAMTLMGNDRWQGAFPLQRLGRYEYAIRAWKDQFASFTDELFKKHEAGVATHLEIAEGVTLVTETAKANRNKAGKPITQMLKLFDAADDDTKRRHLLSADLRELMRRGDMKPFAVESNPVILDAERLAAQFSNWYEIFPRSQSGDVERHGTFHDVIAALPRIAAMGFDVLYFPPIHPIGRVNRKGRNNTLTPGPEDPGSPYAIGATEGGHEALHPALGTLDDFQAMIDEAARLGIEIALDFAIQCAPDHPWLKQHPGWFDWRPDGSLRYAENPPKKYEDIVNVDFYAKAAKPDLWIALRDIVQLWVDRGVKIFRVDNPHTKPLPFWEWLIADIRARHPEVIFLAEAFTRPKIMYRLAKIGFSQSYTYFTWRNSKAELQDYLVELSTTAPKDYFRPHFFVNTPDINPRFLQSSGRSGHLIRAALAATLSGLWGVYNGFELCDATPVPSKEEYLNSEKYQLRAWDYDQPGHINAEITRLNHIRRANTALQTHLDVAFHNAYDDQVIFFSKIASDGNAILVAISLDPAQSHETTIELPLWKFGLPDDGKLAAKDLMRDYEFIWQGKYQPVTLHPDLPFCIWRVQPLAEGAVQ